MRLLLVCARTEGRLDGKLTHFAKLKLLVINELGYLPVEANAAYRFFQFVSRRYERRAMLVTSNLSVEEGGSVFADAVDATANIDRLLHHSKVVTIRDDSYRLKAKRKVGLVKDHATPAAATSVRAGDRRQRWSRRCSPLLVPCPRLV